MDGEGGAPGGFDPCECIISSQMAAARLINMIRQQNELECTDTNCYEPMSGDADGGSAAGMLFVGFWLMMAIILFFLRPKFGDRAEKKRGHDNGPNFEPPAPPATL